MIMAMTTIINMVTATETDRAAPTATPARSDRLVSTVQAGNQLPAQMQSLQLGAIHNAERILGRSSPPADTP
jgi:hypothetical protein